MVNITMPKKPILRNKAPYSEVWRPRISEEGFGVYQTASTIGGGRDENR